MAQKFPKDAFDDVPNLRRVGAHRAPRSRARAWIPIAWAALAVLVLAGGGIFYLSRVGASVGDDTFLGPAATSTATAVATPAPTVDPSLVVNVLNGTSVSGLGASVAKKLTTAGWKVTSVNNADTSNLTTTVVYYNVAQSEGAALGLAKSLPGATTQLTTVYADTGADITVVVGSDQAK